ncbi:ATP-binding protein [Polaromonas sp. SM01]|nr:ATP-binding protein [Polaromonas sp. SM01]
MITAAHQGLVIASAAAGLTLAALAQCLSWRAWQQRHHPLDRALCVAALVWAGHLLISGLVYFFGSTRQFAYVTHIGLQALIICVAFFLLTSAGLTGTRAYLALGALAVAGLIALHWRPWGDNTAVQAYRPAWVMVNLLAAVLLALVLACRAYLARSYASLLALAGSVVGLGIYVDDVLFSDKPLLSAVLLSQHFFAVFLLLIWYLVTRQEAHPASAHSQPASDFQYFTDFDAIDGPGHSQHATDSAVATERRRIAQDLHDGVGSQLVSILSSLDNHTPAQRAVAMALEQALVDLKMTVHAIDNAGCNVVEALGSLRYRVQHALDKQGISMAWKVETCDELEAVHGAQAQQVLRIAQECLSNVMRHANASAVKVVCRFVPETDCLLFEVYDNGIGLDRNQASQSGGKGLEGMRRRAQTLGGVLLIKSKSGAGTCVRLTLPLSAKPAPRELSLPTGILLEPQMRRPH